MPNELLNNCVDEGDRFPDAAAILDTCCYVDDIVFGASSEENALRIYRELSSLFAAGGFELHKWASFSATVLEHIQEEHRESPHSLGAS